jgi:hypothetical protein
MLNRAQGYRRKIHHLSGGNGLWVGEELLVVDFDRVPRCSGALGPLPPSLFLPCTFYRRCVVAATLHLLGVTCLAGPGPALSLPSSVLCLAPVVPVVCQARLFFFAVTRLVSQQ